MGSCPTRPQGAQFSVSRRLLPRQIRHVQMQGEVRDSPWSYDQNVRFQADALDQTSTPGGISDLKPAKEARGGPQRRTLIGYQSDSR